MIHSADEIAYWLEVAEARAFADTYRAEAAVADGIAGVGVDDDDEQATFWLGSIDFGLFNRSIGLGIGQPATEADVDRVLAHFRDAALTSWTVQVSPFARPAALEAWLLARGLRRGRRWSKVWRDADALPEARTALRVEAIGPDRRADWERVVRAAFGLSQGPAGVATIGRAGWHHYLSFDGDDAVGAGAAYLMGDVAWLGYGATLEAFRGRGSQGAMFATRMRDAAAMGARLFVTETGEETADDPNPSYRNMLRAGFRLAYQRQNWLPPEPPVT